MPAAYLDWLAEVFEDAQVPFNAQLTPEQATYLDVSLRKLVGAEKEDEEVVYRRIRERWLKHGLPGRQLLTAFIRDEVYVRKDSPFRPAEGGAYYTNDYVAKEHPPAAPKRAM
ncbi:MAG: hypothetical protein Q8P18_30855 [Pseudomonadota bacterium]|nr:hypothetical protein [Pseudomonadota bacterium]